MFNPLNILSFFKKKKLNYPYKFGLVVSTDSAIENNINDIYNKKIVIYKNGKVTEEIPYTEEDVKHLIKGREIPIVDKELITDFKMEEENYFGEVVN